MSTITLTPKGPFSLQASTRFLEGFAPAAYGSKSDGTKPLRLTFCVEGSWTPVSVSIRARGDDVVATVVGDAAPAAVRRQLERILSLDIDGNGFAAIGRRDPVVADLQRDYPGLRPVCFNTPYEAAAWAIIGQRIRIMQAATIKARIAEQHGTAFEVDGETDHAFPGPATLRRISAIAGLNDVKLQRLHAVADAALAGDLDGGPLRTLPTDEALESLMRIPGIGPFSAQLILIRGAGAPDVFPTNERRLHAAMTDTYQLRDPSAEDLAAIADQWSPYRSWVALLFRTAREDRTGEIAGRRAG